MIIDQKIVISENIFRSMNPENDIIKGIIEGRYTEGEVVNSLEDNYVKGFISEDRFNNAINELGDLLEKAGRDISKLHKKIMVDKNGVRRQVWVLKEKSDDHIHKKLKDLHFKNDKEGINALLKEHKLSQGVRERLKSEGKHDLLAHIQASGLEHEHNKKHEERTAKKQTESDKRLAEKIENKKVKESKIVTKKSEMENEKLSRQELISHLQKWGKDNNFNLSKMSDRQRGELDDIIEDTGSKEKLDKFLSNLKPKEVIQEIIVPIDKKYASSIINLAILKNPTLSMGLVGDNIEGTNRAKASESFSYNLRTNTVNYDNSKYGIGTSSIQSAVKTITEINKVESVLFPNGNKIETNKNIFEQYVKNEGWDVNDKDVKEHIQLFNNSVDASKKLSEEPDVYKIMKDETFNKLTGTEKFLTLNILGQSNKVKGADMYANKFKVEGFDSKFVREKMSKMGVEEIQHITKPELKKEEPILEDVSQKIDSVIQKFGERVYLNVQFQDKDEAKKMGAKWDSDKKSWYSETPTKELLGKFGFYSSQHNKTNYWSKVDSFIKQISEDNKIKKEELIRELNTKFDIVYSENSRLPISADSLKEGLRELIKNGYLIPKERETQLKYSSDELRHIFKSFVKTNNINPSLLNDNDKKNITDSINSGDKLGLEKNLQRIVNFRDTKSS